ncbi:hypothetical protein SAY87_002552 [Trapa incisa]|uniref:Phosphoglycerate mutase family protein n=1 Tax=Trapa incisa TaxID=236973 RepID=A0AAN7JZV6_9MYRT|nr:hypothetical protein SAY87_002552 [Trapa incisa]
MASSTADSLGPHEKRLQYVVVMRHGDRIDSFEPLWASTAARPWDPPLIEEGRVRAFCSGRKIRTQLGFPIHRVFVSPFLRCIQTAAEAVSALCAVEDDPNTMSSGGVLIEPSRIKVSIEYGLCEMLNRETIRIPPKDGDWGFSLCELESMLPKGTVDHKVQRVYNKLPQWEETVFETRNRYVEIIKALADKHPSENLLLVTHGEGVGVAVSAFMQGSTVYEVDFCAFAQLRRLILEEDPSSTAEDFEVLNPGQFGIRYLPSSSFRDG